MMDSDSEDVDAKGVGAMTLCGLLAAMDSASAPKATSLMNCRSCHLQKNGSRARTPRPSNLGMMDSDSEDVDAKGVGATTLCGLLASMDSASALKATSLMNCRSCHLQKNGFRARTPRPSNLGVMDSVLDVLSKPDKNDITVCFDGDQEFTTTQFADFYKCKLPIM